MNELGIERLGELIVPDEAGAFATGATGVDTGAGVLVGMLAGAADGVAAFAGEAAPYHSLTP